MSTGSSTVEFASDCALRRQQARLKLRLPLGPLCAVKERARASNAPGAGEHQPRTEAPGAALELSNKLLNRTPGTDPTRIRMERNVILLAPCSAYAQRARRARALVCRPARAAPMVTHAAAAGAAVATRRPHSRRRSRLVAGTAVPVVKLTLTLLV